MPNNPLPPSPPHVSRCRTELQLSCTAVIIIFVLIAALSVFTLNKLGYLGSKRAPVTRAKADLRSLATGIEAYYIELNAFPAAIPLSRFATKRRHREALDALGLTTVNPGTGPSQSGITTPVPYLTDVFIDPFSGDFGDLPLAYWPHANGWIAWSAGPDGVYQIRPTPEFYDPSHPERSPALIDATYDPTNGTKSAGDVWRVKD